MISTWLAFGLSMVSVTIGSIIGIVGARRAKSEEDRKGAAQTAMMIEKLDNIELGVSELKLAYRDACREITSLRESLSRVEESTKSAHKRIDRLEGVKYA